MKIGIILQEFSGHFGTEIQGYTEKLSNVNWKQVFNLLVVSWRSQPYEADPHCRWAAPQGLTKNLFRNYHCWHQDSHEQLKYVSLPPRFRWRSASLSPRPIQFISSDLRWLDGATTCGCSTSTRRWQGGSPRWGKKKKRKRKHCFLDKGGQWTSSNGPVILVHPYLPIFPVLI